MAHLLTLGGARTTSHFTEVSGLLLHHLEAGSGPTVVLLHGASGGAANWYRLIGPLSRDFHVVALDLPGFGLSDSIAPCAPLGVQMAELLDEWLDVLSVSTCSLLATSFGALPAFRLAQRNPGRVERVALVDPVGLGREVPLSLRIASLAPLAWFALRPSRFGTRWQFFQLMMSPGANISESHVDGLLEYLWQSAIATDQVRLQRGFRLFSNLRGQREVLTDEELRTFPVPLLLIWGERDLFLPLAHGQRAAGLVPRATLRIIPGAAHSPNWEAPEAVLECLAPFLREKTRS